MYGEGISKVGDILDLAATEGIIEKTGTWYSYGGERLGQGRENSKSFLKDHTEITEEVENKLLDLHGLLKKPKE